MRNVRGTFLIFALAAVTLTVTIVFAFLKAVELQRNEGVSTVFPLLAQQAALYGLHHAQEELIKDYRRETVSTLDAPGRAMFRAADYPLSINLGWADASSQRIFDQVDVTGESRICRPMWDDWMFGEFIRPDDRYYLWSYSEWRDWFYVPGRGRWFEIEFRNRTNPTTAVLPTPVPFPWDDGVDVDEGHPGDQETGTLTADIQSPVAYDARWNRIATSGSAADARAVRRYARYRMRYAVVVRDLDSTLLVNPDPDIDWRSYAHADPRVYADPMQRMVARHMHLVPAVANAAGFFSENWVTSVGAYGNTPEILQSIFIGRGHRNNFTRSQLPLDGSAVDIAPRSMPLMYRSSADIRSYGNTLYNFDGVTPSEVGGAQLPLTANRSQENVSTGMMLMGPQASPFNVSRSATEITASTAIAPISLLTVWSPFGRGLSGKAQTDGVNTSGPYDGWTSTPWKVNILTAPPAVLRGLLYAYLPPGVITAPGWRFVDLFNETHSDAFSYRAPQGSSTVYPDYHGVDNRPPEARYPGSLMINGGGASDVLGKGISLPPYLIGDPYLFRTVIMPPDLVHYGQTMPATDSYWNIIMGAFSNAVAIAKRGHMRFQFTKYNWDKTGDPMYQDVINPVIVESAVAADPTTKVMSTQDFDRLFLACMGIDMTKQGPGSNVAPPYDATSFLWAMGNPGWHASGYGPYFKAIKDTTTPRVTIRSLYKGALRSAEQSSVMELVLNDFRLSFFGSDPAYTPNFRPLDFNGDGYATCSAYRSNRASARKDPARIALGIGQESAVDIQGQGEWSIADILRTGNDAQRIVPFCISGCVYVGRSRFWEVQVRGEIYDNQRKQPVTNATLQTVLVIDPEARIEGGIPGDQRQNQILFQRWYFDRYGATMAHE